MQIMDEFEHLFDKRLQTLTFASSDATGVVSSPDVLPPIVVDTLDLMIAAIGEGQSLVITTPARESFGQVLASLLAINNQLKIDESSRFSSFDAIGTRFAKGDKLKMGNAVVEFIRVDDKTGGIVVQYNPKCPIRHTLPLEQSLLLQKTDSNRRLSTSKKFNAEREALNCATAKDASAIAELKRKKTFGGTTIVYIGALKRATQFCLQTLVADTPLIDLLLCERVNLGDGDGGLQLSLIGKGQHSGTPSLMIAFDLMDIIELSDDKVGLIQAVVIDVDSPDAFIERNIEDVRRVMDQKIPVFAIVSNAKSSSLGQLRENGFLEWRWDGRTLDHADSSRCPGTLSEQRGFFWNLNSKCSNCIHFNLQVVACTDDRIDELHAVLDNIDALLGRDSGDEAIEDLRRELWMTTLQILRSTIPFNAFTTLPSTDNDEPWNSVLRRRRGYIARDAAAQIERAIDIIKSLLSSSNCAKEAQLRMRIEDLSSDDVLTVVLRSARDVSDAEQYWSTHCDPAVVQRIRFLTVSALKALKAPVGGRMVICGWLGRQRMESIVYGYSASIVELMLYQGCETDWYVHQTNAWKRGLIQRDDTKAVMALKGLNSQRRISPLSPPLTIKRISTPVEETEEKWRDRVYRRHTAASSERGQSVEAIPVRYAEDYIAFYRRNSWLTDVTGVIEASRARRLDTGVAEQAKRFRVGDENGIHEGSFVLLRQTDKDVLELLADQLFLNGDARELRKQACLWRDALERLCGLHYFGNRSAIYNTLVFHGMKKGYQAFKSLLEDPDKIAPGRSGGEIMETVIAIARALGDSDLEMQASSVASAALRVQSAHRRAGRMLSSRLGAVFSDYLSNEGISKPEEIWEPIPIDLDELGEVTLYRVIEVDREHLLPVSPSKIGKLFEV